MKDTRKQLAGLNARTLRELIAEANSRGVMKDDIVQAVRTDDHWVMLYYEEATE